MDCERYLKFDVYCLDRIEGRLWRGANAIRLTRKALSLLLQLALHAGRLVTKDELLATVWPRSVVVEGVLTTAVRELRRALGDPAHAPRFVETVHGRGYRFIALVTASEQPGTGRDTSTHLVGREAEWAQLRERSIRALSGVRQLVFVAGEAGIGKTALIEAFTAHLATESNVMVLYGQCVEHYGTGEAYLPIFEALGRLARGTDAPHIAELLRTHAPSWLPHLPALLSPKERDRPAVAAQATSVRMLRELSDLVDRMAAIRPLALLLEDLHWSDTATLDWLAYVARRRDPARLIILATYRPVDAIVHTHPLRALVGELQQAAQCVQIMLDGLPPDVVGRYVQMRFRGLREAQELARLVYQRTSGHPFFLITILESLIANELLREESGAWSLPGPLSAVAEVVPLSVRQLIERQIDALAVEDQALLEAASAAGDTFTVAAIVDATGRSEGEIENRCMQWIRQRQFLVAAGSDIWPNGTASSRFRFRHTLFYDVVYRRVSAGRRVRLHRAIGRTLAAAHADDPSAIAAELAIHFEEGGDIAAAIGYRERAARRAVQRSAYHEALKHVTKALTLLEQCPDLSDRAARQLQLQLSLGTALMATKGWAVPDVEEAHLRARELCEQLNDEDHLVTVVWGLIAVNVVRAELQRTRTLSEQLLELTRERHAIPFQLAGHMELAGVAFGLGELRLAHDEFAIADRLYDRAHHREHVARAGVDVGVFARSWWSHLLWQLGDPRRAVTMSDDSRRLARSVAHPFTHAIALSYASIVYQFLRDTEKAAALAEKASALCSEHGFAYYRTWAQIVGGWCRMIREPQSAVTQIGDGIATLTEARARRHLPYFHSLLAEAHLQQSALDEADRSIATGLQIAGETGECWWQPELLRVKGTLSIARGAAADEARAHIQAAYELASRQQNRSLMLRAATSLATVPQSRSSQATASRTLAGLCDSFDASFQTRDLIEARAALQASA